MLPLKEKVTKDNVIATYGTSGKEKSNNEVRRKEKSNIEVCWKEHKHPAGKWVPDEHLIGNASLKFTSKVLLAAPSHIRRRKILEAFFIALKKTALNDQASLN